MRKIIGSLLIALMVGCTQVAIQPPSEVGTLNNVQTLNGPAIATQLNTLYSRKWPNCNKSDSQPAFLCSGVTLRVTVKDPANTYKVWDPSPISVESGGVSYSYLRADANFGRLAWGYGNGYILYPIFEAPADKIDLDYLCSYPMDAWGWHRSTTEVCGPSKDYPTQSQLCQNAGVTTAQQWLAVWNIAGGNPNLRQCGFDIRDERNAAAGPAFYQSLVAKPMLGATGFNGHNEIIIKVWTPGQPNTFPIMAFFYIAGGTDPKPLADAQYNQRDFYNSTNPKIVVPIIRLTPATSATGTATFTYVAADQVVTQ
ncbi:MULTISPECIES: halovibrin HvnC [Pseudomonas]|uniref:Halovibrin HvnC n=1 Tax=Pseudomonas frederiksbergensis TaxID=104087 RepID=A0A2S8HNW0_9PSED|nr:MULTISPECIES: halovibrin HvnC [Pseudomonas]PQP04065.1 halovibrin HvnC [Pseudomonas frederiksbergensis]WLG53283.1 halovibrin HvnC [Pseudomonas sp. FP1742]